MLSSVTPSQDNPFCLVVENFGSYYMEMKKREVLAEKKKRLQVNNIQGGFFHWYPPKNSKCQPVSKF